MVLWTVYIHVLQASSHHIINISSSSSSRITASWMLSLETNIISECNGQRDTIQYYSAQLCVCLSVGLSVNRRGMSAAPPIDPPVSFTSSRLTLLFCCNPVFSSLPRFYLSPVDNMAVKVMALFSLTLPVTMAWSLHQSYWRQLALWTK